MRTAEIYIFTRLAGTLTENDDGGFVFLYNLGESFTIAQAIAAAVIVPGVWIANRA
ncbi:MAG: hypothetical protein IJP66_03915 [Kiritimatiellae bacterium]|nr:hypothetical protein [Kiritimatiellia bacterium]